MGYLIKAGLGLALFLGGVVVFNMQLQDLLEIGTCASGNVPFQITQECPEGMGSKMLLLTGSIFAGLIGCALFAFRGDPPWGERKTFGLFGWGTLAWGIFFAGTGVALLLGKPYGELVNEAGDTVARPDSQLGATITAITFLVMGVPALLLGLWSAFNGLRKGGGETPASSAGLGSGGGLMGRMSAGLEQAQAAGSVGQKMPWGSGASKSAGATKGGGDAIGKIERLQKLRESGAITDSEFEREKAKILGN